MRQICGVVVRTRHVWRATCVAAVGLLAGCSSPQTNSAAPLATSTTAPATGSVTTPALGHCPTGSPLPNGQRVIVHLVDYVVINGVTYLSNFGRTSRPDGLAGRVVAHVQCHDRVPDAFTPPAPSEGSASFLAVGTALHATKGLPAAASWRSSLMAVGGPMSRPAYLSAFAVLLSHLAERGSRPVNAALHPAGRVRPEWDVRQGQTDGGPPRPRSWGRYSWTLSR